MKALAVRIDRAEVMHRLFDERDRLGFLCLWLRRLFGGFVVRLCRDGCARGTNCRYDQYVDSDHSQSR